MLRRIKYFIVSFIVLLNFTVHAQLPAFTMLEILPAAPTAIDSVKLVCHAMFPSGGCEVTSYNMNLSGGNVFVDIHYNVGVAAYICQNTDTINLGLFGERNYTLLASLYIDTVSTFYDTASVSFTVSSITSQETQSEMQTVLVYPNPTGASLFIDSRFFLKSVSICTPQGIQVKHLNINASLVEIPFQELIAGVYIVKLNTNTGNVFYRKVIKVKK